jgi:thiol-disulfide isomerase/thioredoxin
VLDKSHRSIYYSWWQLRHFHLPDRILVRVDSSSLYSRSRFHGQSAALEGVAREILPGYMNKIRDGAPVLLGMLAMVALFLKLPETPDFFSVFACKTCATSDPYLPLIGAGYFALLVTISLLFPSFPGPRVGRAGLLWAILLAGVLTYIDQPGWCIDCLVGHACNILIWTTWVAIPPRENQVQSASTLRERLCLTLCLPIAVVALFSCLNLTFMAYGFKNNRNLLATTLRAGDALPTFNIQTNRRSITNTDVARTAGVVINFVEQDCPYCKEQLPAVEAAATQLVRGSYRFINVSPSLSPELIQRSPTSEWVEDKTGKLRQLFHVSGFPTMFVVGSNGRIDQIFTGVPEKLKETLLTLLIKPHSD